MHNRAIIRAEFKLRGVTVEDKRNMLKSEELIEKCAESLREVLARERGVPFSLQQAISALKGALSLDMAADKRKSQVAATGAAVANHIAVRMAQLDGKR